uniref:Regulator of G protein signaling 18 n=1 Tax=Nothobranchius furzeri TaxID=105023 RepID=A0A8C6LJC3_NOTFU
KWLLCVLTSKSKISSKLERKSQLGLLLTSLTAPRVSDSDARPLSVPVCIMVITDRVCFCVFSLSDGVETFTQFLRTEFSEENIEFWLACEEYKTIDSETKLRSKAKYIYTVFIESEAPKEVNIDCNTKKAIMKNMEQPTRSCFEAAQMKVYSLMKKDSYPRFLHSDIYLRLTRRKGPGTTMFRRRSRSCVFNERGEATAEHSAW